MSRSRWIDITGLPNGKYRLDLGANTSGLVPRERHHEQHRMGHPQDQEGQGERAVAGWRRLI